MEISLYRKLLESEEDRLGMATGGKKSCSRRGYSCSKDIFVENIPCKDIMANNILAKDIITEDILVFP